jgi:hypothetical protein
LSFTKELVDGEMVIESVEDPWPERFEGLTRAAWTPEALLALEGTGVWMPGS